MANPTEIIVYRNPLEAAVWNGLMNSELVFPCLVAMVVFLVAVALSDKFNLFRWLRFDNQSYGQLALGALAAIATLWLML